MLIVWTEVVFHAVMIFLEIIISKNAKENLYNLAIL